MAGVSLSRPQTSPIGSFANIPGPSASAGTRGVRISHNLKPDSMDSVDAQLGKLIELYSTGLLEVWFSKSPDKVLECAITRASSEALHAGTMLLHTDEVVDVELVAYNPLKRDKLARRVRFDSVRTEVLLGNAGVYGSLLDSSVNPRIYIMGQATNPIVTLRDVAGNVVGQIGFSSLTLGAAEYVVIDLVLKTIVKYTAGVASVITSYTSDFFDLAARYNSLVMNSGPTLECSGLSTNGNCFIDYLRAWMN